MSGTWQCANHLQDGLRPPVRALVPILPVAELVDRGIVKESVLADLRRFDYLINYLYLPPIEIEELFRSDPDLFRIEVALRRDDPERRLDPSRRPGGLGLETPLDGVCPWWQGSALDAAPLVLYTLV
jgi:hypothetical protein